MCLAQRQSCVHSLLALVSQLESSLGTLTANLNSGDSSPLRSVLMLLHGKVGSLCFEGLVLDPIDVELSNKLAEELKLEGSMDEGMEIPLSVKEYLENGPFRVFP